ncbi:MAG: M20/M25/M40 family metallo-hydrolase, partial [Opitutales bacterium]
MNTTEALARLDDEAPEMEATLLAWCAQNSGSHHLEGLAHMHGMLAEAFSAALEVPAEHLDLEPGKRGAALRLRKHPEAPVQVLCSGHMDTVFGPESPFQDCTRLPDGRLRGPGTADMKGGLLIMLKALETLERSSLAGQVGWTVVITADEELGSDGSAALLAEEAARHALGLVFESSLPAGDLIGERSGIGSFRAVAHGRAAHTARDPAAG